MTGMNGQNSGDAELWRAYRRRVQAGGSNEAGALERQTNESAASERQAQGPCPDALLMSAYLDGRLPPAELEAFEAHLAGCPRCVDDVLALRALLADGPALAPARVIERAQTLVARPATARAGRVATHHAWWVRAGWSAAAAGLALAVSGLGFGAGQSLAQSRQELATSLSQGASAGLPELFEQGRAVPPEVTFFLEGGAR